jgi:hypothetical protein
MKAWKTFVAVASLIGGIVLLAAVPYNGYFWDNSGEAFFGVVLAAGGVTYIWRHSRFFREEPKTGQDGGNHA